MAPAEYPIAPGKAVLGKILFWEEQSSSDDTIAYGTCHIPSTGFAEPLSPPPRTLHMQAFLSDPRAPSGLSATRAAEAEML